MLQLISTGEEKIMPLITFIIIKIFLDSGLQYILLAILGKAVTAKSIPMSWIVSKETIISIIINAKR